MPTSSYAARANLYDLWKHHPEWKHGQFAAALGYSKEWVKKWHKRLKEELALGKPQEEIFQGHCRARKQSPPKTHPVVVAQILSIRDHPEDRLAASSRSRSHSERDPILQQLQLPVPSCKTIYRIRHATTIE